LRLRLNPPARINLMLRRSSRTILRRIRQRILQRPLRLTPNDRKVKVIASPPQACSRRTVLVERPLSRYTTSRAARPLNPRLDRPIRTPLESHQKRPVDLRPPVFVLVVRPRRDAAIPRPDPVIEIAV